MPDVPVAQVSAGGGRFLRPFRGLRQENWGRVEPILVGLQRKSDKPLPGKSLSAGEQVVIDARMTPLQRKRIEMLAKIVGPIAKDQLAAVPGNMASAEASLPNQRMFGGLRDVAPPNELIDGRFMPWLKLRNAIVGYLGYQGDPGFLQLAGTDVRRSAGCQRLQAERHRPVAVAVWRRMPSSPSSRRCWPRWRRSCVSSRRGSRPSSDCTSTTSPRADHAVS